MIKMDHRYFIKFIKQPFNYVLPDALITNLGSICISSRKSDHCVTYTAQIFTRRVCEQAGPEKAQHRIDPVHAGICAAAVVVNFLGPSQQRSPLAVSRCL